MQRMKQAGWRKRSSLLFAILAVLVILWFSKSLYQWVMGRNQNASDAITVQTVKVKEIPMPMLIETVGSLTAIKEMKIKATALSKVQKLWVEGGSYVKAGTELATLVGGPEVRAPFDGYLNDWEVEQGEIVNAGTELVEFVNTDTLSLTYRIPEQYANELDVGQEVQIKVRAFPDKQFVGAVKFISPVVDKKTFTVLVRAEINNADQSLWPGMSARIRHILKSDPNALVIPEAALILTMEGYEVLVVENGHLVRRSITLGERTGGRVHIPSGLKLGESILLTRNDAAEEGVKVIAEDWQGDW